MEKLYDIVENMKELGNFFIPYNFPIETAAEEDKINILKFREVRVDGYDVILHFNKHDYGNHYLETFQLLGKDLPFLPFCLTCKLAKMFLGSHYLSLIEVLKDNRKIYCWTVVKDRDGKPMSSPYKDKSESCVYEDLEYSYVPPDKVNSY
jgi:hypothetical protein